LVMQVCRRSHSDLRQAFERMTDEELRAYIENDVFPEWYTQQ
jgi:hypothetical protein